MEAVTAVNIQTVYDNPFTALNPLTAIAREIKNTINSGPAAAVLPERNITNETTRSTKASTDAIL